ncbi:MAG: hypothetical protein Q4G68_02315 [Planctomycetia bacterium]|nr:hypothetical protein [Planctomycetia bacterium]
MKLSKIFYFSMLLGVSLLVLVGCNSKNIVPVSGTVTIEGKPVANVRLTFRPVATDKAGTNAGFGAIGTTDANGHYEMEIVSSTKESKGASVGQNRVKITLLSNASKTASLPSMTTGNTPTENTIPVFPWGAREVNTTIEIPAGGTSSADFALPLANENMEEPSP